MEGRAGGAGRGGACRAVRLRSGRREGPGGFVFLRRGVRAVSNLPQIIAVVLAATGMPQSDESKLFRWTLRHSLVLTALVGGIAMVYGALDSPSNAMNFPELRVILS